MSDYIFIGTQKHEIKSTAEKYLFWALKLILIKYGCVGFNSPKIATQINFPPDSIDKIKSYNGSIQIATLEESKRDIVLLIL